MRYKNKQNQNLGNAEHPERGNRILFLVVFTFDGNNIFFPIDDKPKNQKKLHYFKRVKNIEKKYQW